MLFFFTPAGLEGLFDELSETDVPLGAPASIIASLNAVGAKYGATYFESPQKPPTGKS